MKMYHKFILLLSIGLLSACSTIHHERNHTLMQKLNTYQGLSANEVQQQLDLKDIGITLKEPARITEQQLIYTFERAVPTAASSQLPIADARGRFIPMQTGGSSESYSSIMTCHIIFNLQQQRVSSIQLKGRAC
ncbi:hypothetical protein [Acinetobacter sp. CFCC 10889]|uniref:hypothetical protein n=1 Tax=Acinetobacter sp. CFCC 10889 TaxID=1775557 RepID=UPI0013A70B7A|nr:hypothetical protein [Acinetobacter sp. CFCC 10889]